MPGIDEWNNKRQGALSLKTKWDTKDTWFRIFTGYVGFSLTNHCDALENYTGVNNTIMEMANLVAFDLNNDPRIRLSLLNAPQGAASSPPELVRIKAPGTSVMQKQPTKVQILSGRMKGSAIQRCCFICGIYQPKKRYSAFQCSRCGTCFCKIDRSELDPKHRNISCLKEHLQSEDPRVRCDATVPKRVIPKDLRSWEK